MKMQFRVPDMTCGHCVQTITAAVREVDASATVQALLDNHRVIVDAAADPAKVEAAIRDAGYSPEQAETV